MRRTCPSDRRSLRYPSSASASRAARDRSGCWTWITRAHRPEFAVARPYTDYLIVKPAEITSTGDTSVASQPLLSLGLPRLIPNKPKVTPERVAPALERCPALIPIPQRYILLEDDFGRQRILGVSAPWPAAAGSFGLHASEGRVTLSGVPPDPCHK